MAPSELTSLSLSASLIVMPLRLTAICFDVSGFLPLLKGYLVLEKHSRWSLYSVTYNFTLSACLGSNWECHWSLWSPTWFAVAQLYVLLFTVPEAASNIVGRHTMAIP